MADTGDLKISIFRFHLNSVASIIRRKPSKKEVLIDVRYGFLGCLEKWEP
jgi:hypothetical protein